MEDDEDLFRQPAAPHLKQRTSKSVNRRNFDNLDRWNDSTNMEVNHGHKGQGNGRKTKMMGFLTLEALAKSDLKDLHTNINDKKEAFFHLLESPIDRPDVYVLVMELLSKICESSFDQLKLNLLLEICNSQFITNLRNYLMDLPYTETKSKNNKYWKNEVEFWKNFIRFCECIILMSPQTALNKCRSLIEGTSKLCLEELTTRHNFVLPEECNLKLNELRETLRAHEKEKDKKEERKSKNLPEEQEPPDNFRELSVLPRREDIMEEHPYLRANLIQGNYRDVEHYLDVQFRLLREDCFGPLREGIRQFMQDPTKRKYDNIRVFRNVKFVNTYTSPCKVGFYVEFDKYTKKRFKNINWSHSKRFIFGSLVLFTKDNCNSFLVATIIDRDVKALNGGKIPVSLVDNEVDDLFLKDTYTMIESEVYFEPYYHILKALQDPTFPQHIAMKKYIIDVDPQPSPPKYLNEGTTYKVMLPHCNEATFTVLDLETWPSGDDLQLNESQYDAYKTALTHEFAVIQGPPGTGKTYLGIKVAQTLLENVSGTGCLLLLVCYTNHALDQFLEALIPVTESIVRIGGRSRNEALEKFNLNELRKKTKLSHSAYRLYAEQRDNLKSCIFRLQRAQKDLDMIDNSIISFTCMENYVPECRVLVHSYKAILDRNKDPLYYWLFENLTYNFNEPVLLEDDHIEVELGNIDINDDDNRNAVILDDFEIDLTHNYHSSEIELVFSLQTVESTVSKMIRQFHSMDNGKQKYDLYRTIIMQRTQIRLFKQMKEDYLQGVHTRQTNRGEDLTYLSMAERWMLYFSWTELVLDIFKERIIPLQEAVSKGNTAYEETRMLLDRNLLKNVRVVGMTTSGAARLRKLLQSLAPPIVIVEEAAEVLEQHIITSLTNKCQHLILIGDHQQLRPSASHLRLAKHFNLEVSLFERMILNAMHSRRLRVQHRMRPQFSALISPHIYPDLLDHPSVAGFPDVRGVTRNLFFFTHDYREEGKKKAFRYAVPMIWREQKNHSDNCYFCSCNMKGYNSKRKQSISYPNMQSAIRPIPNGTETRVPKAPPTLEEISVSDEDGAVLELDDNSSFEFKDDRSPKLFSQGELNDLGVSSSWFRYCEKQFTPYFAQEDELVYCTNIEGLMETFKILYDPAHWRIFIDSSKRSLKAVLLHNGSFYASIPLGHSVYLKETYKNLELVLCKLKYKDHGWQVCGDFKILGMLLGQQSGFTKFPCFLCLWDSRDRANHWTKKCWPARELKVVEMNVLHETLVPRHKVLLPPLHIKLGLLKQFVKSLPRDENCFKYLVSKFPGLSEAKLKKGVFVGPDIRRLMADPQFIATMTDPQREGWIAFKEVEEDSSSRTNKKEADMTLSLANYIMQQGYEPEDVTILAAYSGQMFYMRKQRPLYTQLSKVKITVVDNYQGEESKIILLSLVRNNDQNKIGFLGMANRICVALSRAKEGFYIFGNIDILKANSSLWENIAKTLESQDSLGRSIKLKCENHVNQITTISCIDDFSKVPEGGCLLKCNYNLPCLHACPLVCHNYDRGHTTTKCHLKCERIICELQHVCPMMCKDKCEPCKKMITKTLPCGHDMQVFCYLDPQSPKIKCLTTVPVKLPLCGHEVKKSCYMETKNVKCPVPCELHVERCGHACVRTCHVADDPDHEHYVCTKPCVKAKKGCTMELVGDRGDHQCRKKCHEECDDCNVEVVKKRSLCKHKERVACSRSADELPCRKKCARTLPCGHFCKKKCSETCGDCRIKVKKVIPECGHEVEVECKEAASRKVCAKACERLLACGHRCRQLCRIECSAAACTELLPTLFDSPCGHQVQLPCNVLSAQSGTLLYCAVSGLQSFEGDSRTSHAAIVKPVGRAPPAGELLRQCRAACGAELACGHACAGDCARCQRGCLHVPCAQRCRQTNICGHECDEPCNQLCPPCNKNCEMKCTHARCPRPCGAPCVPCQEDCARACSHGRCSRRCGEQCSRAACTQRCPRRLPCGHRCRGLCGERCPDICKPCRPDDFPVDFLGDEFDDDALFIVLEDCGHVMEFENMEHLMNSESESVSLRACPFCRKPIINTPRYKDLVNHRFKTDINPIKERVYGNIQRNLEAKKSLLDKIAGFREVHKEIYADVQYSNWKKAFDKLLRFITIKKKLTLIQLDMHFVYLNILEMLSDIYKKFTTAKLTELQSNLAERNSIICCVLVNNIQKISQQQQMDIGNEMKRMNSIVLLSKLLSQQIYIMNKDQPNVIQVLKIVKTEVLGYGIYKESSAMDALKKFQNEIKASNIVTKEERDLIVKAIGAKAGQWYKCPNGHFYSIGQCGGAMEISKCVECKVPIGGQNHALLPSNKHAPEIDNSKFPAWSQEANNMGNFDLDNLL
ncbi:unnamed protein product [Euphydryas editha]|uniref:RZ-type domain-containing protein n=1 Tax=Euphydryas editha TaxID=104508 RepID=A0AAU9UC17_EUPED|nr:unnamed protein product [Euphydryas editha]